MKAIFEEKVYTKIPTLRTVNDGWIYSHRFDHNGVELEATYSSEFGFVEDNIVYSHSKRYEVNDDLYRLSVGDNYFLKDINLTVKILDKTIINDNEIVFLVNKKEIVECDNYYDICDELRGKSESDRKDKIAIAEKYAIERYLKNIKADDGTHTSLAKRRSFVEWTKEMLSNLIK